MSELTPCNFCSLNRIKESANEKGMKITLKKSNSMMGGTDVYTHPPSIEHPEEYGDKYFSAWMMEIPIHCCC
jgi:hypothetical protein